MKLYGYFRSSASYRVRIALNLKGLAYQQIALHLRRGEQRTDESLARNPQGLVPVLKLGDGTCLTQSSAILEYLEECHPEPALLPSRLEERAVVRALAQLICCEIQPLNNTRVLAYLGQELGHEGPVPERWSRHWIAEGFAALESLVECSSEGRYCYGDRVGLADVCLVPQWYNAERVACDLAPYPRLTAVVERLRALPAFAAAAPEVQPDAE